MQGTRCRRLGEDISPGGEVPSWICPQVPSYRGGWKHLSDSKGVHLSGNESESSQGGVVRAPSPGSGTSVRMRGAFTIQV